MISYLDVIQNKILPLDILLKKVASHRVVGRKIAFTNGCFDILHRGHLHYLAQAKSHTDILIVGVNSDSSVKKLKGPGRPIFHEHDRLFHLASLHVVDYVILFNEDTPLSLIKAIQPDILIKGGDYDPTITNPSHEKYMVGSDIVRNNQGTILAIPFIEGYSTSHIIKTIQSRN